MAVPRRATLDDMAAVARIRRLAFFRAMPHMPVLHTPEEDLVYYRTVVFPSADIRVAEQSGIVAGFIAFRPGWVDHLYIHPDHQGCGLGSTLLTMAQASDEDSSNKLVSVETQVRWLREIGFQDVDCHWKWLELAFFGGT